MNAFEEFDGFVKSNTDWLWSICPIYGEQVVKDEIKKMRAWTFANPRKIKKNWKRFIVNWLNKCDSQMELLIGHMTARQEEVYYASKRRGGGFSSISDVLNNSTGD